MAFNFFSWLSGAKPAAAVVATPTPAITATHTATVVTQPTGIFGGIFNLVQNVTHSVATAVQTVAHVATDVVQTAAHVVVGTVQSAVHIVGDVVHTAVSVVGDAAETVVNVATDPLHVVQHVAEGASAIVHDVVHGATDVVHDTVNTAAHVVHDVVHTATDVVEDTLHGAVHTIGDLFGIHAGDQSGHDSHQGHDGNCGSGDHHDGAGNGGVAHTNNFPTIPVDTLGVTFSVDLNGDGVNDEYAVVKAPDNPTAANQTLQHYYDQVAQDLATSHPDLPTNHIVVKATVYSASQGESYYHFNGDETTTAEQDAANAEDHHDDDTYDHNHEHDAEASEFEAHNGAHLGSGDHGHFYSGLISCHSGSHGEDAPVSEDDEDHEHAADEHAIHFC